MHLRLKSNNEELRQQLLSYVMEKKTSPYYYISPHFGKIIILALDRSDAHQVVAALKQLDQQYENEIQKSVKSIEKISVYKAYALAFKYANRENRSMSTYDGKRYAEFLAEKVNKKGTAFFSPRLIVVSDAVSSLFNDEKAWETLKLIDTQTIILRAYPTSDVLNLLISGIQSIYDKVYYGSSKQPISKREIMTFLKYNREFDSFYPEFSTVLKVLDSILSEIQCKSDSDNLLVDLTSLLPFYASGELPKILAVWPGTMRFAQINSEDYNDIINLVMTIQATARKFETTLNHLAAACYNFASDKTYHFLEREQHHDEALSQLFNNVKGLLKNSLLEGYTWSQIIGIAEQYNEVNQDILKLAKKGTSAYDIHELAKRGKTMELLNLLNFSTIDINKQDGKGYTPLVYAMMHKRLDAISLLIDYGATLTIRPGNESLILLAARLGVDYIVDLFLDLGLMKENEIDEVFNVLCISFVKGVYVDKNCHTLLPALAYLLALCDRKEIQGTRTYFLYDSLIKFRKNVAILWLLHEIKAIAVPEEILVEIASYLTDAMPMKPYNHVYKEILNLLLNDQRLFQSFLAKGLQEFYEAVQDEKDSTLLQTIIKKVDFLHLWKKQTPKIELSDEERKQNLIAYFKPRNLLGGSVSLAALSLTKKNKVKADDRRLAVNHQKVSKTAEMDVLTKAIFKACQEMDLKEINKDTYHKLAGILNDLLVKKNTFTSKYSPSLFVQALKTAYLEDVPKKTLVLAPK